MPPVRKLDDQPVLVATSEFPFAHWKFEEFNPVQSRIFDEYSKDTNGLIAAQTSSGKTVVAEMFLSHEIRERGGKGMFLAPLRALTQEKIDDWTDPEYHFHDRKTAICTGDYRMTPQRQQELEEADLIIMTSEMLSHRARSHESEKSDFLKQVGTIIVDESHLLTVPGRGDHLEVGLMKFTEINPNARLVLLSATMPNVTEIAEWISYSLTKRDTFVLDSKYRPCPLTVHYEHYDSSVGKYMQVEEEKVLHALEIVEAYSDDKFIIFAHGKTTGNMMVRELKNAGIQAEFHSADLNKDQRVKLERSFKEKKMRVIVATPTLSWGCNLPARRVIILGVHRGFDEVEAYNIRQMIGRAGRVGLDPAGDAYILVPDNTAADHVKRLSKSEKIKSQLLERTSGQFKVLAFHLVSEIYQENIKTNEDVHRWYRRSLAYWQSKNELDESVVDSTLDLLRKIGAIRQDGDVWKSTTIGKVSSMFYISPFDVSSWGKNFRLLFERGFQEDNFHIAMALGNTDTNRMGIVSKAEREELGVFINKVQREYSEFYTEAAIKAAYCYYTLLNGTSVQKLYGYRQNLKSDLPRVCQVLSVLDSSHQNWFRELEQRLVSGVPTYLLDLSRLPGVAKVRAKRLYDAGITTVQEFADFEDRAKLQRLLNMKPEKVQEILDAAEELY